MKYKLKKWYTSLPKDWKVGIIVTLNSYSVYQYNIDKLNREEVENNPEFWELVVEKDWEVLCYKHNYNSVLGDIFYDNPRGFENLNSDWSIYSIRRLSDGEIFSVGDKLDFRDGEVRKITDISLDDTGVSEFSKRGIPWLECGKDYGACLDWAVHYKDPVLITEDGVELFEGDRLYIVTSSYYIENFPVNKYDGKNPHYKYFSTKEAAEKYIEENKPMYNKKDILDFAEKLFKNLYSTLTLEQLFTIWKKEKGE